MSKITKYIQAKNSPISTDLIVFSVDLLEQLYWKLFS